LIYEPSKRCLTWPNGAIATLYNAVEPDQLRGPQHAAAWCDELAKWQYAQDTWDQLQFGLRLGYNPQTCITTTPRPILLLKHIMKERGTVITRGSTLNNAANLAPKFLERIVARYQGTRLSRQELDAEILEDMEGALWRRSVIDEHCRKLGEIPPLQCVVVAIDPAMSSEDESNEMLAALLAWP
jgi:phage terminase large subunit-like protein